MNILSKNQEIMIIYIKIIRVMFALVSFGIATTLMTVDVLYLYKLFIQLTFANISYHYKIMIFVMLHLFALSWSIITIINNVKFIIENILLKVVIKWRKIVYINNIFLILVICLYFNEMHRIGLRINILLFISLYVYLNQIIFDILANKKKTILICPECSIEVSQESTVCPKCGTEFENASNEECDLYEKVYRQSHDVKNSKGTQKNDKWNIIFIEYISGLFIIYGLYSIIEFIKRLYQLDFIIFTMYFDKTICPNYTFPLALLSLFLGIWIEIVGCLSIIGGVFMFRLRNIGRVLILIGIIINMLIGLFGAINMYMLYGPPPSLFDVGNVGVIVINMWSSYTIILFEVLLIIYLMRPNIKKYFVCLQKTDSIKDRVGGV